MAIKYEDVVPWGRNYSEYVKMFSLELKDLNKKIIGCGDGPASFNYEGTKLRYNITSVDPIYNFTKLEIEKRIEETYKVVLEQTSKNFEKFIWEDFKNIDELAKTRIKAMKLFLNDYDNGLKEKRYIQGQLPKLNFLDNQFELALCSHFLFLYSDNMDLKFHIDSINEMLRISREVRIFPIIDNNLNISKHYSKVCEYFKNKNYIIEEIRVDYQFQKGGNRMIKIIRE